MGLGRWPNGKNTCSKLQDLSLEPQNLQSSCLNPLPWGQRLAKICELQAQSETLTQRHKQERDDREGHQYPPLAFSGHTWVHEQTHRCTSMHLPHKDECVLQGHEV